MNDKKETFFESTLSAKDYILSTVDERYANSNAGLGQGPKTTWDDGHSHEYEVDINSGNGMTKYILPSDFSNPHQHEIVDWIVLPNSGHEHRITSGIRHA